MIESARQTHSNRLKSSFHTKKYRLLITFGIYYIYGYNSSISNQFFHLRCLNFLEDLYDFKLNVNINKKLYDDWNYVYKLSFLNIITGMVKKLNIINGANYVLYIYI